MHVRKLPTIMERTFQKEDQVQWLFPPVRLEKFIDIEYSEKPYPISEEWLTPDITALVLPTKS